MGRILEVKVEGDAQVIQSMLFFILAGLCEIGGGYLVGLSFTRGKEYLASPDWSRDTLVVQKT